MTILDEIVEYKKSLIHSGYYKQKLKALKANTINNKITFKEIVQKDSKINIIAELKAKSPTVSDIPDINMETQLKLYEQYGASAISILTDEKYFDGSYERLYKLSQLTSLPVLCKDFIIAEEQIDLAHHSGASIILLIVNILNKNRLIELYNYAKEKNLEVLVEVHDQEELEIAHDINAEIIGINNRDLKKFITNVDHTNIILKKTQKGTIYISESGIRTVEDLQKIVPSGIDGALIGESLMKHPNIPEFLPQLRIPKRRAHNVH